MGGKKCQRTLHKRTTRVLTMRNLENSVITLSTGLENELHTSYELVAQLGTCVDKMHLQSFP